MSGSARSLSLLSGVIVGVLALAAARFVLAPPLPGTHYHANWAIFVDGQRLDLSSDRYMEEVSACHSGEGGITPAQRTHLHANEQDIVHVHDDGVTWGQLMANLGFGLGDDYLILPGVGSFVGDRERTLKFIVDGVQVLPAHNRVIRSGEMLLITYGAESVEQVLSTQFPAVASNAEEYNQRPDPAGCSGAEEVTLGARLKHAFVGR